MNTIGKKMVKDRELKSITLCYKFLLGNSGFDGKIPYFHRDDKENSPSSPTPSTQIIIVYTFTRPFARTSVRTGVFGGMVNESRFF